MSKQNVEMRLISREEDGEFVDINVGADTREHALARLLSHAGISRTSSLLAAALVDVLDMDPEDDGEYWPGYKRALEDFKVSAELLLAGWQKHDDELRERHRKILDQ